MKYLVLFLAAGLCACSGNGKTGKTEETMQQTTADVPSRKAYEGFEWERVTGAGLSFWAQHNPDIRVMADPSLPGAVVVRNGDTAPRKVIQVFELKNRSIEDVLPLLQKEEGWDASQSCQFKEVKSGREGVKRYLLVPAGSYAAEVDKQMKEEPVPSTCSGWGVGNSGMRYFEVQDSHPDQAVFVEIGQDAPLFDESSICLTAMDAVSDSTQVLYNLSGEVRIGHEVRSFRPENSDKEYWLVDKTGTLTEIYDRKTGEQKNGKPLQMMLKLEYNGKWDDGFAADYDGVYFVREVLDGQKNPEGLKKD